MASFNATELGGKADKIGKDDNFRGLTVFDNVLYYTKGSGSNGVNTVYFVDTTGTACPNGVGVPAPGAKLPTSPLAYDPATLQTTGLPSNMCILKGFPTTLAKASSSTAFPFGLWFANPHTLYVADEGSGDTTYAGGTYTNAAASTTAGLQKWVLDPGTGSWQLAYTLRNGLNLGRPYSVAGYPIGNNSATSLPWAPATDELRNITGRVNRDGGATIWGVTSTVSGSGDQGADPNQLVAITDDPSAAAPSWAESFHAVVAPKYAHVVRGVTLTPGPPLRTRAAAVVGPPVATSDVHPSPGAPRGWGQVVITGGGTDADRGWVARGMRSQTSAPPPGRFAALASPPCARAIVRTMASPKPTPPRARAGSARLKRSNARATNSSPKPEPWSLTPSSTSSAEIRARRVTGPAP